VASAPASGEDSLIARYFKPIATDPGAFALIDDAAVLQAQGADIVVTTDAIVEGVHFLPDDPPETIARKALRVNLSDLAAKGAAPAGFLLALALPDGVKPDWLQAFAGGLGGDAKAYGCPLLGGDTVKTPGPLMVSIAAFGFVPQGKMLRRHGAKPGDAVIVTGTIGDAALGLALRREADSAGRWNLNARQRDHLLDRYLLPQPRNAIAALLQAQASAGMDVSDGLAGDLAKLCRASGISAEIDMARVPLSDAARAALIAEPALIETVLSGGDDYEILCTVPGAQAEAFIAAAKARGVAASAIGRVTAGKGAPRFLGAGGQPLALAQTSFSHF